MGGGGGNVHEERLAPLSGLRGSLPDEMLCVPRYDIREVVGFIAALVVLWYALVGHAVVVELAAEKRQTPRG